MLNAMTTKTKKDTRRYLYLTEWRDHAELTDAVWAERIGVSRETIWRWQKEQWRLDPGKIKKLADSIGIEPEQFWRPPGRPSIDAILKDASMDVIAEIAVDAARKVVRER